MGLPLKLFFFLNQVNLFDFKFVQKAEILIANFNGKKNNFPVPRNIAFCVNSVQTLCLKIHSLRLPSSASTMSPEEGLSLGTEFH